MLCFKNGQMYIERNERLDDDPAKWVTINGQHIPLNSKGEAIGGNPKVLGEGGGKSGSSEKTGSEAGAKKTAGKKVQKGIDVKNNPNIEKRGKDRYKIKRHDFENMRITDPETGKEYIRAIELTNKGQALWGVWPADKEDEMLEYLYKNLRMGRKPR